MGRKRGRIWAAPTPLDGNTRYWGSVKLTPQFYGDLVKDNRISPTSIAGHLRSLGGKTKAIECLAKAYEERSGYIQAVNGDMIFDSINDEPGFRALLAKLGLPSG